MIKHSEWSLLSCVLLLRVVKDRDEFHSNVCALMGSLEEFGENSSAIVSWFKGYQVKFGRRNEV
jgi:hypothetical protein